jgi:hypothetical protein
MKLERCAACDQQIASLASPTVDRRQHQRLPLGIFCGGQSWVGIEQRSHRSGVTRAYGGEKFRGFVHGEAPVRQSIRRETGAGGIVPTGAGNTSSILLISSTVAAYGKNKSAPF